MSNVPGRLGKKNPCLAKKKKADPPTGTELFEDHPDALAEPFCLKKAIDLGRSYPVTPIFSTASPMNEI